MDQDIEAVGALLNQGEFEEAEVRACTLLRTNPWLAGEARAELTLHYATACARQVNFGRAVELAMGMLRNDGISANQRLMATRLLCVGFAHLGMPAMARPFISGFGLTDSPHCSDRCWPGRMTMLIGDAESALYSFSQVLEDFSGHPFAQQYVGIARMALGDSGGMYDYQMSMSRDYWRMFHPHVGQHERMWDGESLAGRSITIVPLGGYGDYFQFLRYVPALRRAGVREIVAVAHQRCHGVIASAGVDRVVGLEAAEQVKAETDCWASTFALERLCLMGENRAAPHAYLAAPPSATAEHIVAEMRTRAGGRPCIGIYWYSDAFGGDEKSLALHDLLPLLMQDSIHWVILQRGFGLRRLLATGLHHTMTILDESLNFDETAGVISGLDGVVTICSWPLHLAGALGVRTWFLAGRRMDYRHWNREHDSVLYPGTVTLVRQPRLGDWPGAVAMLKAELQEELRDWQYHHGTPVEITDDTPQPVPPPEPHDSLPPRPYALTVCYKFGD